jgi:hypothetical protein
VHTPQHFGGVGRDSTVTRSRKKEIPNDGGKKVRILSIPAIRDGTVQGVRKLILELWRINTTMAKLTEIAKYNTGIQLRV